MCPKLLIDDDSKDSDTFVVQVIARVNAKVSLYKVTLASEVMKEHTD